MDKNTKQLVKGVQSTVFEQRLLGVVKKLLAKECLTKWEIVRLWACQDVLKAIAQSKEG